MRASCSARLRLVTSVRVTTAPPSGRRNFSIETSIQAGVHAGGFEVFELAASLASIEHIPQGRQVLRRVTLTEFRSPRARRDSCCPRGRGRTGPVRELHATPPGIVDLDDRA
jgi:hypothetical protein